MGTKDKDTPGKHETVIVLLLEYDLKGFVEKTEELMFRKSLQLLVFSCSDITEREVVSAVRLVIVVMRAFIEFVACIKNITSSQTANRNKLKDTKIIWKKPFQSQKEKVVIVENNHEVAGKDQRTVRSYSKRSFYRCLHLFQKYFRNCGKKKNLASA